MRTHHGVAESKFQARSSKFEANGNGQNLNVQSKSRTKTNAISPFALDDTPSPFPSPRDWGRGRGEGAQSQTNKFVCNRAASRPERASGEPAPWVQGAPVLVGVLLLAMVLFLSACAGKSAPSKFYVLNSLPQSPLSAPEGGTIGVFPVTMPDYLDRPQVVTRVSENELNLDEFSRWAEPLRDSFTRALVQDLSTLLNTAKVIRTAESPGIPMALQVGVEVVQFDGTLGGDVVLVVKWGLFGEGGKKLLLGKRSTFKEPTGSATYDAYVAAESRAVSALSREIAEAIKSRK
jgi:uncharacterized lipoprotein YmbA